MDAKIQLEDVEAAWDALEVKGIVEGGGEAARRVAQAIANARADGRAEREQDKPQQPQSVSADAVDVGANVSDMAGELRDVYEFITSKSKYTIRRETTQNGQTCGCDESKELRALLKEIDQAASAALRKGGLSVMTGTTLLGKVTSLGNELQTALGVRRAIDERLTADGLGDVAPTIVSRVLWVLDQRKTALEKLAQFGIGGDVAASNLGNKLRGVIDRELAHQARAFVRILVSGVPENLYGEAAKELEWRLLRLYQLVSEIRR